MPFLEQTHRAVHLREQARDRRLSGPGIAEENEMLGGRDLRQPILEPLSLYLEECEQRAHLLLHGCEPDERVELYLQLA